jgi:tetratricopeptide (TPR) repeat protein
LGAGWGDAVSDERRAAALRRLGASVSARRVEAVAGELGVSSRTVWRWVAQASGRVQPAVRGRFVVDDDVRRRLERWRGNVAAVHRELVEAEAAGGPAAPSLATLHRAVARDLTAEAREKLRGTNPVVPRASPPDPGAVADLDGLVERLRLLKVWAGDPSYEMIKKRVNAGRGASELVGRTTVADCFRAGRRRLDVELLVAVVRALHPDVGYVAQWRQALQVAGGKVRAAAQVRVQGQLPPDLAGFTGRAVEVERLLGNERGAVVISAIEGMAGVGKTQLAVHVAHTLVRQRGFDRVLFVNLRGFHPDPAQPPADPAAVLEGFLRLLGMPGQAIPWDLDGRSAAYRDLLAHGRALVVLDNASDAEQVRPLIPPGADNLTLITSRRHLGALTSATHLAVGVFSPAEATRFLAGAAGGVPLGDDPRAAARIAERCGYLPLALGLMAGHTRAKPGWTLTDHADWLDERYRDRRLDSGVELALELSYQDLPADRQRLLRLLALHPGQDFEAYAAGALAGEDARAGLADLVHDHLLLVGAPGRYAFHDLVRAFATARAHDQDRPAERRAALTRLFDHYLSVVATAVDTLNPGEAHLRPRIAPAARPAPDVSDRDAAVAWLDAERSTLVAVAAHTAVHGWPGHTTRLSRTLFRYLHGGHNTDAMAVHGHAVDAARLEGDRNAEAHALTDLGVVHWRLGRPEPAADRYREALSLFRQTGDPAGLARTLNNLGNLEVSSGRYQQARDQYAEAMAMYGRAGDATGEARAMSNLGFIDRRLGRHQSAIDNYRRSLELFRRTGDRDSEAHTLNNLADAETRSGRFREAAAHHRLSLTLSRQLGSRSGEANALDGLGLLNTRQGRPERGADYHRQALAVTREIGDRYVEVWALNGLGEAVHAAGRPAEAIGHHAAAHAAAVVIEFRDQQARAHRGLGRAHGSLGDEALAREHYERALTLYTELDMPEADEIRELLARPGSVGML